MNFTKNNRAIPDVQHPDDYYPVDYTFYKLFGTILDDAQDMEIGRIYTDDASNTCIISIWDNVSLTFDDIADWMEFAEKQTGKTCEWQVWETAKFDGVYKVKRGN